jgi:hypothetical protein
VEECIRGFPSTPDDGAPRTDCVQEKTRRELGGHFFKDYVRSLKVPDTWNDGDKWYVNYVGHPIHGAAAGYIWLDHEDGSHDPQLGFSSEYWASRGRAVAWAAGYSLQFEFGPLSEALIGNVGLRPGTTGWVDHVVTPVGALGFVVAEDALDRYFVTRVESWTGNRFARALVRMAFNPSRSLSNVAQGRLPWFRNARPLRVAKEVRQTVPLENMAHRRNSSQIVGL